MFISSLLKNWLIIVIMMIPIKNLSAQNNRITAIRVTGEIKDLIASRAVQSANISLIRKASAKVFQATTNQTGHFVLTLDSPGVYTMLITSIGFQRREIKEINISRSATIINLGSYFINGTAARIDTVTVKKTRSPIENTVDKLLYHVERDPALKGTTAEDIFRRLPMVALSYDGQVSLRGNRSVKVFINGKPSSNLATNMDAALRMISSEQIKTIEIMTSPPLKYDAEGNAGIINIITKQSKIKGANGSFSNATGSRQSSSNLHVAARTGQWSISSGVGTTWSWPVTTVLSSQLWDKKGDLVYTQLNDSQNRRSGLQSNTTISYELDSASSLISTINANRMLIKTDNKLTNHYRESEPITGRIENTLPIDNFDISLDYIKRGESNDSELDIAFQYMNRQNETRYKSLYDITYSTPELGHNIGNNHELTFQTDYKTKVKQLTINVGSKIINRYIRSIVQIDTLNPLGQTSRDDVRSYTYNYQQTVLASYATVRIPISGKLQTNVGLRYEKTILKSNQYQNIFPYLAISLSPDQSISYKIKYGQRIQRPSLYFLNPFRNTSDKINQVQGNPSLAAEINHNLEIESSINIKKYNTLINTSLYYKKSNNIIEPVLRNIDLNGETTTLQTFENIGRSTQFGINLFSSLSLFKILSIRANVDLFTYRISPYIVFLDQTNQASQTFFNHKFSGGIDLKLGKGLTFESNFFFDSPQKTFHGEYAAFNLWNLGIKKKILKDAMTVGLSAVDPLSNSKNLNSRSSSPIFLQKNNFVLPFRSFGISFSWQFGNHRANLFKNREKKVMNDDQKIQNQ